jgi:hypothetical protein
LKTVRAVDLLKEQWKADLLTVKMVLSSLYRTGGFAVLESEDEADTEMDGVRIDDLEELGVTD